MFSNLIESASHQQDLARKGRFFLATLIGYALIVTCAGLVSIYAYDAHVENQDLEFLGLVPPIMPEQSKPEANTPTRADNKRQKNTVPQRIVAIDRIADATKIPDQVSANKSPTPEIPKGDYTIGATNTNPEIEGPASSNPSGTGDGVSNALVKIESKPPPPRNDTATNPPKKDIVKSGGVMNGNATFLAVPEYSAFAKRAGAFGAVNVQVLIDETGKVISARASNGNPLLRPAAERAAYQTRFSPTTLTGVAVKVSGVITYNFKLG